MEEEKKILQQACEELLNDLKQDLKWKWDDRLDALLAQFNIKKQDAVRSALEKHISAQWDNKTIKKAPGDIRKKAGFYKDLRAGQLLFTMDSDKNIFIVVAWWPWGDGENISLRIASPKADKSEDSGVFGQIKSFFIKK